MEFRRVLFRSSPGSTRFSGCGWIVGATFDDLPKRVEPGDAQSPEAGEPMGADAVLDGPVSEQGPMSDDARDAEAERPIGRDACDAPLACRDVDGADGDYPVIPMRTCDETKPFETPML